MERSPETPFDRTLEFKADPPVAASVESLEASFDGPLPTDQGIDHQQEIGALRRDINGLKSQMTDVANAGLRPPLAENVAGSLDGLKGLDQSLVTQNFVTHYLRRGEQNGVELKSFSGASGPEGGFAVPREIDALIGRTLNDISPIRSIATVVQTGSADYRKLVTDGGTPSGWVSETAGRPETATPKFNEIAPPTGELFANPAASQTMLDDAAFNVEAWLADEIAREFAQAEGAAFVSGSGINRPRGFLNAKVTNEADAVRAFGSLQYVPSGAAGGFAGNNVLIDLVHALKPAYRQGAAFVMNSATLAQIRKFKTKDGAFLWQPSLADGQPDRLLGYPVVEAEDMPDVKADSRSIAFGNFRAGYLIAERSTTHILRDPFTNKPFVHFYATKRIGGQVMNSEAIKLLQFSAT